jgi:hypothetical protein
MQETLYSDIQLLDRLRSDDTTCFEELFQRHWRMVYFYALKKLHSTSDARSVVASVFVEIWNERYHIPVDSTLPVLLYQKVRVAVVQQLHKHLGEVSANQWIDGYILPYMEGEAPASPDAGYPYEIPEASMEQFPLMYQPSDEAIAWKQWVHQLIRIPTGLWNKPWEMLSRNH